MRFLSLVGCLLLSSTLLPSAAEDDKPAPVKWEEDWEAAQKLAQKTGKPLFVVFRCER